MKLVCLLVAMAAAYGGDELILPKAPVPTLTEQETREGWQLLFDGVTWKQWSLSQLSGSGWWTIENGWIRSLADGKGEGRRLFTLESFQDFELQFDWRIAPEGNSGVKYRLQGAQVQPASPDPDVVVAGSRLEPPTLRSLQQGFAVGFEYQLTDDERAPDALDSPLRSTAALYRLAAARKPAAVQAFTEHHSRIRVVGWSFEHWLDGVLVLKGNLKSEALQATARANLALAKANYAQARTARQRYDANVLRVTAEALLKGELMASPIDLQHHRSGVAFKNLKIRRVAQTSKPAGPVPSLGGK